MPSEVSKDVRMAFIAKKTCDGTRHGKLAFYCRMLKVSRQGFYEYLKAKDKPWKYEKLADLIMTIRDEDICNDCYGRVRVHQALKLKAPADTTIPSERTVYRVMKELGIVQPKRRKPNGLTKAERKARKSDDLLKRDFTATQPATKCVTDITEFKFSDGKLYVSAIFDCYDSAALGLAMDTNMRAELCVKTVDNAVMRYPELRGALLHSDRGSQYTSQEYRTAIEKYGIIQSMNSDGGRCHDNARCESMWARFKSELWYNRFEKQNLTIEQGKKIIWRYVMSYWNNRRICSTNGGLPPMVKRKMYYAAREKVA